MGIKTKIASAIVTGTFLAGIIAPAGALAATNVTVSNNGADSTNKVKIKNKSKVKVKQSNKTGVVNLVGVSQNTGNNEANKNNGGDVNLTSGSATANVTNTTTTGSNSATVDSCGCVDPESTVNVTDNGADSYNKVRIVNSDTTRYSQSNHTFVLNGVYVSQNTGNNEANKNNGEGATVDLASGDASATVTNNVTTGDNTINP